MSEFDELPYEQIAFPETSPRWLTLLARLYGSPSAALSLGSIIEIGCGPGLNACTIARLTPETHVIGLDLSQQHISLAEATRARVGAKNVSFIRCDIGTHHLAPASASVVIAHGIFSWVPRGIQQRILAEATSALIPNGLLYLSYNTLPGWALRGVVRQLMLANAIENEPLTTKVLRSQAELKQLAPLLQQQSQGIAPLLLNEIQRVGNSPLTYIAHEYLAPNNDAFLFSDVINQAASHGLSYLGDARPWTVWRYSFDHQFARQLEALDQSWVLRENTADIIVNRSFRRSIFRKVGVDASALKNSSFRSPNDGPDVAIHASALTGLFVRLNGPPMQDHSGRITQVKNLSGQLLNVDDPVLQLILSLISQRAPKSLLYDELCRVTLTKGINQEVVAWNIEGLFIRQIIDLSESAGVTGWPRGS